MLKINVLLALKTKTVSFTTPKPVLQNPKAIFFLENKNQTDKASVFSNNDNRLSIPQTRLFFRKTD